MVAMELPWYGGYEKMIHENGDDDDDDYDVDSNYKDLCMHC